MALQFVYERGPHSTAQTAQALNPIPIPPPSLTTHKTAGKKGGRLGQKRGPYDGDSRVTAWRRRKKAEASKAATANGVLSQASALGVAAPAPPPGGSPLLSEEPRHLDLPDFTPADKELPLEQVIAALKSQLSHVKNQRLCQLSGYDVLRHMSILRVFEWSREGGKTEQQAALEAAELFWVFKETLNPQGSIKRKADSILQWAKEYRMRGKLEEHTQGAHVKQESVSLLAREEIAESAKRELATMANPGPAALRNVLLNKIFPKFNIQDPKVSENTCRNYMEKWGWKSGGYRKWIAKNKNMLKLKLESDSEEGNTGSEDTAVLDIIQDSAQGQQSSEKSTGYSAPIPSPTTAIRSISATPMPPSQVTILPHSASPLSELQPGPIMITSPNSFSDSSISIDQSSTVFWTTAAHTPQVYQIPIRQPFQPNSQYPQHSRQPFLQPSAPYIPKSLDKIVPDPPEIMGIRPALNEDPIISFVPDPALIGPFAHDSTFPPPIPPRTTNEQHNSEYSAGQMHYMPDLA